MTHTDRLDRWALTRCALSDVSRRYLDLVRDLAPGAPATADWTVADTSAHLVTIAWMDNRLLDPEVSPLPVAGFDDVVARTTVDTVEVLNDACLRGFTQRDPIALAAMLEQGVGSLLRATEHADPEAEHSWLGGARVPLDGLLAHLVNEVLIHGWDVARANRRAWSMPPAEAARFFDVFLAGVTRGGLGVLQSRDEAPPGGRISVELVSAHAAPVRMVLEGGDVTPGSPGDPVDARVHYDPATLALALFGRTGMGRAVLRGRVRVTGRRPWLLLPFLGAVRFPS